MTGAVATSLAVLGPVFSDSVAVLSLSLAVLGLSLGLLDASMNSFAVEVERRSGRPMINGFHAWASGGGMVGSGLAVLTRAAHFTTTQSFITSSVLGLTISALVCRLLLHARSGDRPTRGVRALVRANRTRAPCWT